MLNKEGQRALAYNVLVDVIEPITGSDNCECAVIGGWKVMVKKGQLQPGQEVVYFEVDSLLPSDNEVFSFMSKYKFRVKTQRYTFGGKGLFYSQGLIMPIEDLGIAAGQYELKTDLTEILGVRYYVPEDNQRKAAKVNPYQSMRDRNPNLFKKPFIKKMMKYEVGRKILFALFGRKKKYEWPSHIAAKTDVERIQNCIWNLQDKKPYVATEKVDGSSCSIMCERGKFGRFRYYVCSRNVVFKDENQKTFYDENIYFEMYNKYNFKNIITQIMKDYKLQNVAIQMEIFGAGVQKRDYGLNGHDYRVFHVVSNREKFSMDKVVEICDKYGLKHVPIIDDNYILPDSIDELQAFVENEESKIDGGMKEGIVFYDKETGANYFKFVSPEFLIKYH